MKTLWHAFDGLPIWPRLTLAGFLWGMLCGLLVAIAVMLAMFTAGVSAGGLDWQGIPTLLVGLVVCLGVGGGFGATLGGIIGLFTGLLAGTVLILLVRIVSPAVAAWVTVLGVVAVQAGAMAVLFEGIWRLTVVMVPAIAIAPLAITALSAANLRAARQAAGRVFVSQG
ncbi:hypothetical protein GCM10022234_05740 [Aeromicrobium panaciterrae]|uniref:hypothetical protein n=1 Tax=Aeromicrobium panaciterrae TaxID=363861 RepID=UPI0031DB8971